MSLVGVVLIARPPFLFSEKGRGGSGELRREVQEEATTVQRMVAVGFVRVSFVCFFDFRHEIYSVALSGVAGATCECESIPSSMTIHRAYNSLI